MPEIATQPFTGTYRASPVPSTFAFKIRHSGTFWFRGVMPEAEATLRAGDDGLVLEGAAKVESISVFEPAELRAHLLAPDFFEAERHPEVSFRSTDLRLDDGGCLDLDGELTIKGITRPVHAVGTWTEPAGDAFGGTRGHLKLEAVVDRTEFDMNWNLPLPSGGNALANEVTLTVELSLVAQQAA